MSPTKQYCQSFARYGCNSRFFQKAWYAVSCKETTKEKSSCTQLLERLSSSRRRVPQVCSVSSVHSKALLTPCVPLDEATGLGERDTEDNVSAEERKRRDPVSYLSIQH